MNPNIRFKPWKKSSAPRKILVMRFQALGDTIIILPYLQSLRRQHPQLEIQLLTRKEVSHVCEHIDLFDKVIKIGGGRNTRFQFILTMLKLPYLWSQRYDIVLDLQKHRISTIVRKLLQPPAWAEFDKYSPKSAGERTKDTIESLGLWKIDLDTHFKIKVNAEPLLVSHGWNRSDILVALNPAGSFPSRNWPIEYYVSFAKLWLKEINCNTQFVLLLLPALKTKADYISRNLGKSCIDLTGKSNQAEAFSILQRCSFVLSEDGGLMHMAWVQGIPTIALFSSSRKDWSAPQGAWSYCFDSSDMECGPCDLTVCKYGDNRCLVRHQPGVVLQKAKAMLKLLR